VTVNTETILASLNTHGGRGADGRPYDLEAACRQFKADIIVLQEVWRPHSGPDPVADIAAALGAEMLRENLVDDTSLRSFGIADEPGRGQWGLATLTTVPVTGYEVVDLGRIAGDATPRAAQLVTVELPGRGPLRIANTHLTYRLLSPVQLLRLVRRLDAGDIPTVIAGDLNMPAPLTGRCCSSTTFSPAARSPAAAARSSRRPARITCRSGPGFDCGKETNMQYATPNQPVFPAVYGAWGK